MSAFEIAKLKEELKKETQKRDKWEQSVRDCEQNLNELQENLHREFNHNNNENSWKQKYDKQFEKNTYLEHEFSLMKEKLEALSKTIEESPTSKKSDQPDLDLRLLLRQLEHEKCVLEGKVKDCEWRLDSESKELSKLSDKKREYMLKLNQALLSPPAVSKKKHDWISNRYQGLPDNQRIIDPRKGPIKKQALVKNLPKITNDEVNKVLNENKRYSVKKKRSSKEKVDEVTHVNETMKANDNEIIENNIDETQIQNIDTSNDKSNTLNIDTSAGNTAVPFLETSPVNTEIISSPLAT